MAITISEAFIILKSGLEITDLQQSTVSTRQQSVRSAMENDLEIKDTFLTGSYARHTMIAPLKQADIDILFLLDAKYYYHYNKQNGGQAGLLDFVKRVLKRTYPRTPDISRNGQAVTIQFTDFVVDVVPGFYREGGGYLIPNSITQTWLSTDPKKHEEIWSVENKIHNGKLIPLIKMLKMWNRTINNFFRSFHLEVMALQIMHNVRISDYPSGVRYFFDKGRNYVIEKNPDPAGFGDDVGGYLYNQEKVSNAVSRFQTAHSRALKAEDLALRGQLTDAINTWKMIFGNYFPSYG